MAKYKDWLTDEGLLKIKQWARLGLTDEQIAKNMGINPATYYRWINKYCDICEAIKKGRQQSVEILENAMFKKAIGFTEGDKYYPPDNVSLIFLLKNWGRNQYRDRPYNDLELEKIELENKQLAMKNEALRRVIEGDNGLDKLEELIQGINNEALEDAETVLE